MPAASCRSRNSSPTPATPFGRSAQPRLHAHRRGRARHRDRCGHRGLHRRAIACCWPDLPYAECRPPGAYPPEVSRPPASVPSPPSTSSRSSAEQQRFEAFGAVRFGTASVPGPGGPEVVLAGRGYVRVLPGAGSARRLRPVARARRRCSRRAPDGRRVVPAGQARAFGGAARPSARRSPSTA